MYGSDERSRKKFLVLIRPLLANIALHGMEEILGISYARYENKRGITYASRGKYRMVRYADDFLIFAQSKEDILKVESILQPYLDERGLVLAEDKTFIKHISEGFDFLGFNFRQYKTKDGLLCLNKPSKDSINKFKMKIDDICKSCYGNNVGVLIRRLNPVIRGTANYWRHVVSKKVFGAMDDYIWNKIYKFLRRLHGNKGKKWIKQRYFPYFNNGRYTGNWILTDPLTGDYLIKMKWTPIRRHIMIKHDYSPYDKDKIDYFNMRDKRYSYFTG